MIEFKALRSLVLKFAGRGAWGEGDGSFPLFPSVLTQCS